MRFLNWISSLFQHDPKPPTPSPTPPPVPDDGAAVNRLLDLHNQLRSTRGEAALVLNAALCDAAADHAHWMAVNRNMSHDERPGTEGFTGSTFLDRVKRQGYVPRTGGENIAAGQRNVSEAVDAWVTSRGHYANIVNAGYTDVGFGFDVDRNGSLYWVAVFGGRPTTLRFQVTADLLGDEPTEVPVFLPAALVS